MQSYSKGALPVRGNPPVPLELKHAHYSTYKSIRITAIENGVIVLNQRFDSGADAKAYIDRNLYQ